MKQRHIITLAIIAALISCTGSIPNTDRDEEPETTAPQDTTSTGTPPWAEDWVVETDTTITINGTPVE